MQPFDPKNPNTVPPKIGENTVKNVDISLFSEMKGKDLLRLSVSGNAGTPGQPGISITGSASSGYSTGSNGANGFEGGRGQDGGFGENAGQIECVLKPGEAPTESLGGLIFDGKIVLEAQLNSPKGQIENKEFQLPLAIEGDIDLLANGGMGGDGGRGGRGQNGGDGARGRNATRHSSGGRGGNGGQGGRGGAGGRGGNGANGGKIVCKVPESASHLLLLTEPEVAKGHGGSGGTGAEGGSGGSGGAGGSSYSWTEKRGEQTVTRSNSGGSSGLGGARGAMGSNGPNGADGMDGSIVFVTLQENGQEKIAVQHRFAVQILHYDLRDALEDAVLEFGEYIYLQNLQIKNVGGMDLPPERHVYLILPHSKWLLAEPLALQLPKGLKIGKSHTFEEELAVCVKRPEDPLRFEKPFEAFDTLDPLALMGGVLKRFRNASRPTALHFQHPATISQIKGHHSIARGEASWIAWRIENISSKDLGESGLLQRSLQSFLCAYEAATEDQIPMEHIFFFDAEGKALDVNKGILNPIHLLKSGEGNTIEISCFIGIHPAAEPMQTRMARTELQLAHPDFPAKPETIQAPRFQIRVAKTYVKTEGSDILLVINKDTALKTVQEIIAYYEKIGSKVDVWDISHYGRLDLETKNAESKTLLQDFEGKTILILNNSFQSNQSSHIYSSDLMEKREFLRAANEFGITVYIMGKTQNGPTNIATQFGMPSNAAELSSEYASVEAFFEAQKSKGSDAIDAKGGVIEAPLGDLALPVDNFSNREAKMPLHKTFWFWQTPVLANTVKSAQKVVDDLQKISPRETYYGIHAHAPQLLKKSWLNLRWRYKLGTLKLRQGPHRIHGGRLLTIEADENQLKSGDFFRANDAATKLMLGLSIWDSMELIGDFLDANPQILADESSRNSLMRAFMHHIAVEQAAFRQVSHRKLSKADLEAQMVFFRSLTDFSLKFNDSRSAQALFFQHLFAHTLAMLSFQHSWWNFLVPSYHNLRLTRIVRKRIETWIVQNFDTSGELKRRDKRLWEKNVADQKAFREGMLAVQKAQAGFLRVRASTKRERAALALKHYIGDVQNGAGMRNAIGSQTLYEAFTKNADERTQKLLQFEREESKTIQDLTFSMLQNSDGFYINPTEIKERKFPLAENLVENDLVAPRTELNVPLEKIEIFAV